MNRRTGKGLIVAVAVLVMVLPGLAVAGVDVNISVPLFGLFAYEPQTVVVAPSPYGYAPNGYVAQPAPAGAVFYSGYWYLPSGGNWYIAAQTGGPWTMIGMERVPYAVISGPVLMGQPHTYYGVPEGPSVGVAISPWIFFGGRGGPGGRGEHGGHGHGHDD
jgi:hypothetical protein